MKHTILRALCLLCAVLLMGTFALTGCGSETAAPESDPHAGHNHDTEHTEDAAGTESTAAPESDTDHNHTTPAAMGLTYENAEDGTLTLIIKDCKGEVLCEEKGLASTAISSQLDNDVVELCWITSNNPGGYQCLYINRLTCQVSDRIAGEQYTDGKRILYSQIKDGALTVIVRDLFDENGYCKTTKIEDAYIRGAYTVLGVGLANGQVKVSYLTDKEGGRQSKTFDLYEKGE